MDAVSIVDIKDPFFYHFSIALKGPFYRNFTLHLIPFTIGQKDFELLMELKVL